MKKYRAFFPQTGKNPVCSHVTTTLLLLDYEFGKMVGNLLIMTYSWRTLKANTLSKHFSQQSIRFVWRLTQIQFTFILLDKILAASLCIQIAKSTVSVLQKMQISPTRSQFNGSHRGG